MNHAVKTLVFVYNGEFNLRGGVRYLGELLRGEKSCALCDITHNLILEKKSWKACRAEWTIPIKSLYLDQLDDRVREACAGDYPTVLVETEDGLEKILGREELSTCESQVELLKVKIEEALAAREYVWTPGQR